MFYFFNCLFALRLLLFLFFFPFIKGPNALGVSLPFPGSDRLPIQDNILNDRNSDDINLPALVDDMAGRNIKLPAPLN